MSRTSPSLIIPVENQVREWDGKLLLACAAAERGFDVTIGALRFVEMLAPFLRRSVYLAKSMTPWGRKMLGLANRLGHEVVAWDEEALVRYDAPDYVHWRFSPEGFAVLNHLFAWGQDDKELYQSYHGYHGAPIHVTGNPRVDLLRPEMRAIYRERVDELRRRHGDFILVNTNFAFVNHFLPSENLWQGEGRGDMGRGVARCGRGMSVEFARGQAAHIKNIYDAFRALLPELSGWFPGHKIIVRPHPSENHDTWREFARGYANIEVIHEGSAVPWLLASRVLLHNGCTTAVEAAVLGQPAVSFQPFRAAQHDYALPNALSHEALTPDAVRSHLDAILRGERGLIEEARRQRLFARHIAGTDGPLAVDRIVDVLHTEVRPQLARKPRSPSAWVHANLRAAGRLVNLVRPNHRSGLRYHRQRFPVLSLEQVREHVALYARLLGRFREVRVEALVTDIFRLSRA